MGCGVTRQCWVGVEVGAKLSVAFIGEMGVFQAALAWIGMLSRHLKYAVASPCAFFQVHMRLAAKLFRDVHGSAIFVYMNVSAPTPSAHSSTPMRTRPRLDAWNPEPRTPRPTSIYIASKYVLGKTPGHLEFQSPRMPTAKLK